MEHRASSLVARLALGFLLTLSNLERVRADNPTTPPSPVENRFQPGRMEFDTGEAVLFSPFLATDNRPPLNYELTEIQLGFMLTPVRGSSFRRGNLELAGSAFGGGIVEGRGNYVAGATAWLRYNFVPRIGHFVPFVQAGGGVTDTDLDRRIEGQDFNFNLDLGVGVRYCINPRWSVNVEYRYQHVSNANLSPRNLGVNADGPVLSLSYFF